MAHPQTPRSFQKKRVTVQRGYTVFTVQPLGIRDRAETDEEFTNFATHADFPALIPRDEIWIDERLFPQEGIFYIANAIVRLEKLREGATDGRSYDAGLSVERHLRQQVTGMGFRNGRAHRRVPKTVYAQRYFTLPDKVFPIDVWCVHGNVVRCLYKTDYCEGGHGYVYPWVPRRQIWIEEDLKASEMPYIVSHEYLELRLMRDKGLAYDQAHRISAKVEFDLRRAGEVLSVVGVDGHMLRKSALAGLTSEGLFAYVGARYCQT